MGISYTPSTLRVTTRENTLIEDCNATSPAVDPDFYVSTGSGQTATTVNGTAGAFYEFASGTTINAETIILLKKPLRLGSTVQIQCDRSVAAGSTNTETFIELVEVDPNLLQSSPATAVITSGTDAQTNNARNAYQIHWQANTTTVKVWNRSAGSPSLDVSSITQDITAASLAISQGTSPNFRPAQHYVLKIGNEGIKAALLDRAFASGTPSTAASGTTSSSVTAFRASNAAYHSVNTSRTYALRIRIKNGGTAPAASIITRLYRVMVQTDNALTVDPFTSATAPFGHQVGSATQGQPYALPVVVTQTNSTGIVMQISACTVNLPTLSIGGYLTSTGVTNTETALGANAVYTSGAINFNGAGAGFVKFAVLSDQASATNGVEIQVSNNAATNWRTIANGTAVADTPLVITAPLIAISSSTNFFGRYRVRYTNGAVAQTNFSAVFYGGTTS